MAQHLIRNQTGQRAHVDAHAHVYTHTDNTFLIRGGVEAGDVFVLLSS